jgi:flagellar motor protein MotB
MPNEIMRLNLNCTLLTLCALPMLSGCASDQALRGALGERDGLIRRLRSENAVLQQEVLHLSGDRAGLQSELSELQAVLRTSEAVAAVPAVFDLPLPEANDLAEHGIEVERRGEGVAYLVPSAVSFGPGSAELTERGQEALRALAHRMTQDSPRGAEISVEGHTDSDPIQRSGFASNRELSLARALTVHGFLVAQGGLPDERFVVLGYGPHRPVEPNTDAAGKARNRRVEVVVQALQK